MKTNLQSFKTNEVIKSKIDTGEFDSKNSFRYYINYTNLIYQVGLGKTVQELKKESKIKDNSIKTCLSKDQLNKTHLADLFVANCLELGLKYKEIKDKIIIKTN